MLQPLYGKIKKRRIIVYDLEWVPGSHPERAAAIGMSPAELRLVGVYDGKRYRYYTEIQSFLRGELTRSNRDAWFYAHSGGRHDIQFILDYLINHGPSNVETNAFFTANAASIVSIKRGRDKWYLLDSFFLIRQSLRKIGQWVGDEKGGADNDISIFYAPLAELIPYNEKDCVILWKAITQFQAELNKLGGQLRFTLASSALDLFRRRFLHRTIPNSRSVNEVARRAYVASRVEVFSKHVKDAAYYDINSSFPYAMTLPAPGKLIERRRSSPKQGSIYLADARITIPPCDVPPLPYRSHKNHIFFPHGTWRGWFSNVDLELLEECGGRIESIASYMVFEPFGDLSEYATIIYEMRRNSKSEAEKVVLKFLLNSLYGKFAESEEKQQYIINPAPSFFSNNRERPDNETDGWVRVRPNVYALNLKREIAHAHVPIATHITAIARARLFGFMAQSSKVHYCDTDGFSVPSDQTYADSDALGALKFEKPIKEGFFEAPKLYAYTEDGSEWVIRAKGFPRITGDDGEERPLGISDFHSLRNHENLRVDRWIGVRQALKSHSTTPRNIEQLKTFRGIVTPKRCFDESGESRPWSIDEVLELES